MKTKSALNDLLAVMARLRSPQGCPWDREQDHMTLRFHAVEEVYELIDAIEAGDDQEMAEELGDLLLQVVFHCQLAGERGAFDFQQVARRITEKLVRRHPHVFANLKVKNVDEVWANWEKIKTAEKHGTRHARPSALDGIPNICPPCCKRKNCSKKRARQNCPSREAPRQKPGQKPRWPGNCLNWSANGAGARDGPAEELLRAEIKKQERALRRVRQNGEQRL